MNPAATQRRDDEYACVWCGRVLVGEPRENGGYVFVHDDIVHPSFATYDEDDNPQ